MKHTNNGLKWTVAVLSFTIVVGALPKPGNAQSYFSTSYLAYLLAIRYPAQLLIRLPARDLNGIALNGAYLDDRFVTGVSLDDVSVPGRWPGETLSVDLGLNGTKFTYPMVKMVGATFTATLDDGSLLPIRIDSVEPKWQRADPYVIHYYVTYEGDAGAREPLCGVDENGNPVGAIPLLGSWDYSEGTETGGARIDDARVFTFACEGFVLDKCVDAGYKPWLSITVCSGWGWWRTCTEVPLDGHHQACTRMLRADYCGDGVSYTEDNILVALYDGYGIRYDSERWGFEAEWDEDGAICANRYRVDGMEPACFADLQDDTCGNIFHFFDGALLFSELP